MSRPKQAICARGHERSGANLSSDGKCRTCDRERIAAKRAAMTAEERAEARRAADAKYRATHREQRRRYDRRRLDNKTPAR